MWRVIPDPANSGENDAVLRELCSGTPGAIDIRVTTKILLEETTMARVRDLYDIINRRPSNRYLSEALSTAWVFNREDRREADALSPRLRQLKRESRASRYGLRLPASID
jgi:hypothetical protein